MKATAIARAGHSAGEDAVESKASAKRFSIVQSDTAASRRTPSVHLTTRQLEVLALLCEGLPNKLICRRLNISAGTVKAHISSILRELGVASRLQAVVWARHRRILTDLAFPGQESDAESDLDAPDAGTRCDQGASVDFLRRGALN